MRDYGIDLTKQLEDMSWRQFMALCANLNPYGATSVRLRAEEEKQGKEPDEERDRRQAEAFFSSIVSV